MRPDVSHRERVRLALDHQDTDRVPIAFVCSGINRPAYVAWEAWLAEHRQTTPSAVLDPLLDIRGVGPAYVGPELPPGTDMWGVHRSPQSYGADAYAEIDVHPLAGAATLADLDTHRWPSTDWFDYSVIPEQIRANRDWCLMLANFNVFESAWYMRGFQQIFIDLALEPDFCHALLERVTGFFLAHLERCLQAGGGGIDLVFTADDIGGQNGLLMALPQWEQHLKPYHVRINRVVHEYGARVIYHSDGSVMEAVPGLMDMGIDILQALQFDARGMDPAILKERYGDRLCFQGGVSVQHTLPFGTPDEVRAEVAHLKATLGRSGGYILGPSHAIQAGTPPENITAMLEEAVA
ncbi:MAG: hypothetical protein HYU66_28395 [Armatimonadetes bacterium]|nr:hypothetical protein [Armatimonadota bacterium]